MPPLIVWALSAVGAAVIARWVAREARRINAELHPHTRATMDGREDVRPLVQDPVTGVYRPK
jgi:hypothetical protein